MLELDEKIPNNVNLSKDAKLKRALEKWQPNYLKWWKDMGPDGFQDNEVFLRTAISVEPKPSRITSSGLPPRKSWAAIRFVSTPPATARTTNNSSLPPTVYVV